MTKTTMERFWDKVNKNGPSLAGNPELGQCWLWLGSSRHKGYGAFVYSLDGEVVQGRAHRYSYQIHCGRIPPGLCVLHKCDNPPCVNPSHLFPGTKSDNNRDKVNKGRHVPGGTYTTGQYKRGINHHAAKLTPELVRHMRVDYASGGMSYSKLAKKYGMSIGSTWRIVNRRAWKHVE